MSKSTILNGSFPPFEPFVDLPCPSWYIKRMEKEYLIQLTKNLYRLTLLFPKKEPLRYKMREIANEILANFYKDQNPEIFKNLEILDGFFEVAKSQNWVSPKEILQLQNEYGKIKSSLNEIIQSQPSLKFSEVKSEKNLSPRPGLNEREKKILEFLKENIQVQVWQIKKLFPEVSKRTLRRDFNSLLKKGLIERIGERNNTFYKLKEI